ncbi:MAG: trypsin-like peptidase domain-containing protein [Phycisphaeraceae bacterium]|nr:trypsin-like peptidase domain-containing protein [Phycisphaeraceae bacterium]
MKLRWNAVAVGAGLAAAASVLVGLSHAHPLGDAPDTIGAGAGQPVGEPTSEDMRFARSLSRAFVGAVDRIEPSVVHIMTRVERPVLRYDLFGRRFRDTQVGEGLGTGVVARQDGYILTNNHVVEDATTVRVRLLDGREYDARVVGLDPATDLAVIKVDASGLAPIQLADSDDLQVGEIVLAVGSPFGFSSSVTHGIVSALGRTGLSRADADQFEDFIQTDAAINPGNSGGPLVNLEGGVVGINSAIFTRSGGSQGIGFAIPSNIAGNVLDSIIRRGRVERGWLGVEMRALSGNELAAAGVTAPGAVSVVHVVDDSPAQRAGLHEGDLIVGFDGRPVTDDRRLRTLIATARPGAPIGIDIVRNGSRRSIEARLADAAEATAAAVGGVVAEPLGLVVSDQSPAILRQLGYQRSPVDGVVVLSVLDGGPAQRAGLAPGDIIYRVGTVDVANDQELLGVLARSDVNDGVRVYLLRDRENRYVDVVR